jgi:hypothetical protein
VWERTISKLTPTRRELLATSAETWASFPLHAKYEASVWSRHSTNNAMMLIMIRLEALYTEFILHKLVMNQDHSSRKMLIEISHVILSLVLSALSRRLNLAQYRMDLEWSVSRPPCHDYLQSDPTDIATQLVNYAMPCASVLILELLRQVEQPQQHTTISRSTLIQDLSVLISCCDWLTEPDQQNYRLCKRAQSIFSRSLDRILNGPTNPPVSVVREEFPNHYSNNHVEISETAATTEQHMLIDDPEWMAWLETCNLEADPWLDILANPAQAYPDGFQDDIQNHSGDL